MCSVRARPIPSAPNFRAFEAEGPSSAFARTFSWRKPSAHPSRVSKSSDSPGSTSGTTPRTTRPVVPSIEMTSPSLTVMPPTLNCRLAPSIFSASAPQTAGLPIPRATTAACDVLPPCEVRIPLAAIIPWRSSGLVSRRTSRTASPLSPSSAAVSASKTALPVAAPGEAFSPLARTFTLAFGSN